MKKLLTIMLISLVSCKQIEHLKDKDRWQTEFDNNDNCFWIAQDSLIAHFDDDQYNYWLHMVDSLHKATESLYKLMYPTKCDCK